MNVREWETEEVTEPGEMVETQVVGNTWSEELGRRWSCLFLHG